MRIQETSQSPRATNTQRNGKQGAKAVQLAVEHCFRLAMLNIRHRRVCRLPKDLGHVNRSRELQHCTCPLEQASLLHRPLNLECKRTIRRAVRTSEQPCRTLIVLFARVYEVHSNKDYLVKNEFQSSYSSSLNK